MIGSIFCDLRYMLSLAFINNNYSNSIPFNYKFSERLGWENSILTIKILKWPSPSNFD